MKIIIFDTGHKFTEKELRRLASIGVKEILTLDYWYESEPVKGKYNFDRLIKYEKICHKLGIKLLVVGPFSSPLWIPKEWFLKNKHGEYCDFSESATLEIENVMKRIHSEENIEHNNSNCPITGLGNRILSYWNPKAQNHLQAYKKNIKKALKHSKFVLTVGQNAGEFFFPYRGMFPKHKVEHALWWYDKYALESLKKSNLNVKEWLKKEFLKITRETSKNSDEKWFFYVPTLYAPHRKGFEIQSGNIAVKEAYEENREGLNTIVFEGLKSFQTNKKISLWNRRYNVFTGSQGCKNILSNFLRAEKLGFSGLICNPSLPYVYAPIKEWQYKRLEMAFLMNKKGKKAKYLRLYAHILKIFLTLEVFTNEIDRYIGIFGLCLKKIWPKLYWKSKKFKDRNKPGLP